ncbi:hypothetical protein FV226_25120 [Methylobacterium sp. WL12]|uniref:hypothetical protein n=2 Tax=unclassified Methylobacterium TaxID=2615210 RepID=UPI0011CCDDE9|nr:hypothetical protein [Methylobacterium sp. WL12]TXM65383.1 hypothetical protein FV226_25120 [Methylobacterium sp. WL12]
MRIYTETPFRMTPPLMAVVVPEEQRSLPHSLWVGQAPGPIAREALEAIGLPSDGDEIRIEARGDVVTVNRARVTQGDAVIVYCAWHCTPNDFREDPSEEFVHQVRHAITVRLGIERQLQGLRA